MATRPRSAGDRVGRRPQLAVEELGRGEPLVLLHGLATTRQIWNPVVSLLAARRRVVTVDLPGFGESPAVGPGFDLHCVAEGLVRGLTARRVTAPFDLVGHSLGGAVAVTVAADQPKLVSRLVLVAPAGFATAPALPVAVLAAGVDAMFAARRWLAPLTDLALGRKLLLSMAVADGAAIAPTQARLMVQASAHASRIAAAFEAVACADLRPALRSVDAPLGLIWGELDRTIAPRTATHLMADRPDAQLEVVAGAGHVPMVERPSAFAAAVIQLLQDLPKHATSPARAPVSCGEQGLM